jgi:hypothetical protein
MPHFTDSWAQEGRELFWLQRVAPQLLRERRRQRMARVSLTGLVLWTTTAALLREHGCSLPSDLCALYPVKLSCPGEVFSG